MSCLTVTQTYPSDKHETIIDTKETILQSNKTSQNNNYAGRDQKKDGDNKQNKRQTLRVHRPHSLIEHDGDEMLNPLSQAQKQIRKQAAQGWHFEQLALLSSTGPNASDITEFVPFPAF